MAFWIVAGLLVLLIVALLLLALLRTRADPAPAASHDMQVYRDQLDEVERDLARGVLRADEADRAQLEVSRRLLEADRAHRATATAGGATRAQRLAGAGLVLALMAGAVALYWQIGQRGYPDMPLGARIAAAEDTRANRPTQAEAEAAFEAGRPARPELDPQFAVLLDRLRAALQETPDDLQGLELLAVNEARAGNYQAAAEARRRVIEVRGDAADAGDMADLAELMIVSAGGLVTAEAEAQLDRALALDPRNGPARYYYGLMFGQTGRPDLTFRIWRDLLADSPPDAPWYDAVAARMPSLAQVAGVRWTPPDAPGPSAADIEAAAEMTPEERMQMIRGMVDGLAARLAEDGGSPQEWARLIGALGVLGDTGEASAIWTEAQTVFAGSPEALEIIRAAAVQAGVAP